MAKICALDKTVNILTNDSNLLNLFKLNTFTEDIEFTKTPVWGYTTSENKVVYDKLESLNVAGATEGELNEVARRIVGHVVLDSWIGGRIAHTAPEEVQGLFANVLASSINQEEFRKLLWREGIKEPTAAEDFEKYFLSDSSDSFKCFSVGESCEKLTGSETERRMLANTSVANLFRNRFSGNETQREVFLQKDPSPDCRAVPTPDPPPTCTNVTVVLPSCDIIPRDSLPETDGCRELAVAAANLYLGTNPVAQAAIAVASALFIATFAFIGSFVLLFLGIMLIVRYVAMGLLIILAPLAWVGFIFPKLKIWSEWWKKFIRWLLFAPAVMFFFFLSVQTALTIDTITPVIEGGNVVQQMTIAFGNMILVIGLLVGGIIVANRFSLDFGGKIYGGLKGGSLAIGKWAGGIAVRGTTGTAGTALRAAGRCRTEVRYGISSV